MCTCITLSVTHVYKHKKLDFKIGHSEFVWKKDSYLLPTLVGKDGKTED